jgi:hypothetical protein
MIFSFEREKNMRLHPLDRPMRLAGDIVWNLVDSAVPR